MTIAPSSASLSLDQPALAGPKRQHFLPRFYLQGFTGSDGCLAVHDRVKREVRRQQPLNTGAVGHLYTVVDDQGRQRFELERALSEIESAAARHLPGLIQRKPLSFEARGAIAHYLGTLAVRTPEFIESIRTLNGQMIKTATRMLFSTEAQAFKLLRAQSEHAALSDSEVADLARRMVDFAEEAQYDVEADEKEAMTMALPMGETIAEAMAERHWSVWKAPSGAGFVVGDAPVVLTLLAPRPGRYAHVGFASPDALVLVPLDSSHALAMFGDGRSNDHRSVDRATVRRLNIEVASRSQRFVMGRDNTLVDAIARAARLDDSQWKPKFGIGGG